MTHSERETMLIRVSGTQFYFNYTGTEEEPIEVISAATHELKDGEHILVYEEAYEGLTEKTRNEIHMTDDRVQINKTGVVTSNMVFEEGRTGISYYTTPFGVMQMRVATTRLETRLSDRTLEADISYALSMNGDHVADCRVNIKAEPPGRRL